MRKLLVKLVAAETAVLGWLTYWLFLIYANNPGVSQELTNQLSRFPQISYTTIDISIIVIIAVFSILLAVKFDRGLRPGMKLERALQMLENLMKRNLFLESQLAEFRGDKISGTGLGQQSQTSSMPTGSFAGSATLQQGSWEQAFRTPLEAGPSALKVAPPTATVNRASSSDSGPKETRAQSIEPNVSEEKRVARAVTNSSWEDSPAKTTETRGIITPSPPPTRKPLQPLSTPTISGSPPTTRLPYIPVPAPRPSTPPPSVIVSAVSKPSPIQSFPKPGLPAQARPTGKQLSPSAAISGQSVKTLASLQPLTTLSPPITSLKPTSEQPPVQKPVPPRTAVADDEPDDSEPVEEKDDGDYGRKSSQKKPVQREQASFFDEDSD